MPLWHCDVLYTSTRIHIGLIEDESTVAPSRCGPKVDLQPLSKNLADTVDLAQGADPSTSEPNDTTPAESSPGISRAHSSS